MTMGHLNRSRCILDRTARMPMLAPQCSTSEWTMTQRLHLVFGGELTNPSANVFKDVNDIHIVGMYPDYASAFLAWKAEAQRTVDNAHMRYYIAHIHRLRDAASPASATEEMGE
jgi:hypothetical protein